MASPEPPAVDDPVPAGPSAAATDGTAADTVAAETAPEVVVERLAAAVMSTAKGVRGRVLYVGWSEDDLPAATGRRDGLSDGARQALDHYRATGLDVRKVPFARLVPASYLICGPVIDFADTRDRVAEDQVQYSCLDATGERRDYAIGELGILRGITLARQPWQAYTGGGMELAVSTVPLYSVFAPLPDPTGETGLALLFEPTIPGASNEAAFRSFVRMTIGRLLVLDESQPPGSRRGYLDVAGRVAGVPPKGGLLGTLVRLRGMGFVEFDDSWLRDMQRRGKQLQGGMIRFLRAIGMVEVTDGLLNELTDPRPDYDVDPLDTARLVDMAEQMYGVAAGRFGL
ncbi:MAG: hypothetical protein ABI780_08305 [Ardenticatenales bacterium]